MESPLWTGLKELLPDNNTMLRQPPVGAKFFHSPCLIFYDIKSNYISFTDKNPAMKTEINSNDFPLVLVKELKTHKDDRGYFREVIRFNDPFFEDAANFGQWSHSRMVRDVVKAWHYHHVQTDWWYVGIGLCEVVLIDYREESPTFKKKLVFKMGENPDSEINSHLCVKIPPGVLHACRVLSDEAHLFYVTSQTYNPNDEGRFAFDKGPVEHYWGENPLVADNDKRDFVPTAKRVQLTY